MKKEHKEFWDKLQNLYINQTLYLYNDRKKRNEYIWHLHIKDDCFCLGMNTDSPIKVLHAPWSDKDERSALKLPINDKTIKHLNHNIKIIKSYTISLFEAEMLDKLLGKN